MGDYYAFMCVECVLNMQLSIVQVHQSQWIMALSWHDEKMESDCMLLLLMAADVQLSVTNDD